MTKRGRPAIPFWDRVDKSGDCWLWRGTVDSRGYGHSRLNGRPARAHRIAYELSISPIAQGEGHHGTVVMHTCDNRLCCNPDHLRLGSHADNMADMKAKGRRKDIATGADNGRAVLSPEQVRSIRSDPRSLNTITKDYPVSRAAIQRIKSGKAWASL